MCVFVCQTNIFSFVIILLNKVKKMKKNRKKRLKKKHLKKNILKKYLSEKHLSETTTSEHLISGESKRVIRPTCLQHFTCQVI